MCTSKLEVTDLNKMSIFMQKKEATGQAKQFLTVKYSLLIQQVPGSTFITLLHVAWHG